MIACGARTGLDVPHGIVDASTSDILAPCDFGTVVSDISGNVVSWNGGAALPAGHYRVTYVDGCMKYSTAQDWSVNAYAGNAGPDEFWIVSGSSQNRIVSPPGTIGFVVSSGGFATFDECVQANEASEPLTFDFAGGPLGVWLADSPYTDNVAGKDNRNPTWRLSSCP